jgi:hypothetical protein
LTTPRWEGLNSPNTCLTVRGGEGGFGDHGDDPSLVDARCGPRQRRRRTLGRRASRCARSALDATWERSPTDARRRRGRVEAFFDGHRGRRRGLPVAAVGLPASGQHRGQHVEGPGGCQSAVSHREAASPDRRRRRRSA